MKYTAKIIQRIDYKSLSGKQPLYLQVTIHRKTIRIPLYIHIETNDFDANKQTIKIKNNAFLTRDYNLICQRALAKCNKIFVESRLREFPLSVDEFKKKYGQINITYSFTDFINSDIEKLKQVRSIGTIKNYKKFAKRLADFCEDIDFFELNYDFIMRFDGYLNKNKFAVNTKAEIHKNLKFFINQAIRKDIPVENPYTKFKLIKKESDKQSLTKEQVTQLLEWFKLKHFPAHIHRVLQYFLFSALVGGIRYQDIVRLKSDNIEENMLIFQPLKTKRFERIVKVPLPDVSLGLLPEKFLPDGRIFSSITNQKTNIALKEIGSELNLNFPLTFHIARHTFATVYLELGGTTEVLMKQMGITKYDTVKTYIHIVMQRQREQMNNMNKLSKKSLTQSNGSYLI